MTDGQGRTVDFRNAVIIMTSNAGAQRLAMTKPLGFAASATSELAGRKVVLAKSSVVLNVGQQTRVEASVSSGNMPVYSSSNTSIATVEEDGTVTAVSQGKAYIYATEDGVKAKLTVTVKSDSDKKKQK